MSLVTVTRPADAVALLTIDRPERRNALSIAVRDEMSDALDGLADDPDTKVVVIASVGPVFSAGFDLREFEDPDISDQLWASSDRWHERLRTFPLPVVAAVQGAALAGGFDLATMCDLRVAARSATFGRPERRWSVVLYSILADLLGGAHARELSLTDRVLSADEALAIGLVTRVVDDGEAVDAAVTLAEEVAVAPREGLLHVKRTAIAASKIPTDADFAW